MKKILYILSALTLALTSCVKEEGSSAGAKLPNPEGVGMLNVKIEIPETAIATRALSKDFDFTNSTLHLAVFDGSTLSEYALAENVGTTTGEVDGKTVTLYQFTVNLTLNAAPIHVHMVLNGPDNLSYGYEDELMSRLSVSGNTSAYWGYVDLPDGITAKQVWDSATQSYEYVKKNGKYVVEDAVTEKFQKVPMVRNFAWLTVGTSSSVTNFTLDGIVLVNEPKEGTVAPYNRSTHAFMTDYKTYDYPGIVSAYSGNMLSSETFDGTVPADSDFVNPSSGVFMYERTAPTGTQAKTTIIARGKYNGETVYYKIDLADVDGYYTVYRNFHYNITITNVAKKGSATIADAIQSGGTADPTTDTDISSLDDISNGVNRLYVQYVDTTVTSAQDMVLRYKFIPDVDKSTDVDNDAVTLTVGNKGSYGEAIEGSTCTKATSEETYGGSSGWRQVTFKTTGPGTSEKHQSITVTGTSNSSSVKIVVMVRVIPKQTLSVECVNGDPDKVSSRRNAIRDTTAAPLDVRTTIPVGLPESIFPLVFDIEVVQKSLTPRAGAYLPVTSGKSNSGSGKATYMFQRTLTYSEYVSLTPSDSKVTFSSLFKSNIAASASEVYVANPYFNTGSASFTNYHVAKFSNLRYQYSYSNNSDGTQTAKVDSLYFEMEYGNVFYKGNPVPVHVYIEGGTADTTPKTLHADTDRSEGWYIYVPDNEGPENKRININPDNDATSIYVQLSTDESSPVEYETAELRGNFVMRTVTFETNSTYFGRTGNWWSGYVYDNTETSDGVTLTFNNLSSNMNSRQSDYLILNDGTFTITSTSKNIARVDIHYYSANGRTYDPQSVTADSGTFNDDYTDWRAHGILTDSVTFTMDANTGYYTRTAVSSIVVYLAN